MNEMLVLGAETALTLVLIWLGKWLQDVLTTFDDDHELFSNDNPSLGVAKAGYYLAIAVALKSLFMGEGSGGLEEIRNFFIYGCLTLLLLNISTYITDRFIMSHLTLYDEICKERNDGVSWSLLGCYLGAAFILQGAMSGDDVGLLQSCIEVILYFTLGQAMLLLANFFFCKLCPQHRKAIDSGNAAAGISFGGFMTATGLCIGTMSKGNLHLNVSDVSYFVSTSISATVILIALRHFLFNHLFAGGTSLNREIYEDRNSAAGWIVALGSIGVAQLFAPLLIA